MTCPPRLDSLIHHAEVELPRELKHYLSGDGTVIFDSRSEAATGILLERYLPNWKVQLGVSYQVPIGDVKRCDFRISDEVFLEYHPFDWRREIDRSEYLKMVLGIMKAEFRHRDAVRDAQEVLAKLFLRSYAETRLWMVRSKWGNDKELIVASTAEDVQRLVLRRFCPSPPSIKSFLREWHEITD